MLAHVLLDARRLTIDVVVIDRLSLTPTAN